VSELELRAAGDLTTCSGLRALSAELARARCTVDCTSVSAVLAVYKS